MTTDSPNPFGALQHSGTEVHYGALCERKLWWFTHGMEQEHTSDLVAQGRNLHEKAYERRKKEVEIDGHIRIDGLDAAGASPEAVLTVHEVKKSRGGVRAQRMQLLYYLYALRSKGLTNVRGVIDYPTLRRREELALGPNEERELEGLLARIEEIKAMPRPPHVADPMGICEKCAYQELCWG